MGLIAGSGGVGGSTGATDNAIVRADGTGGATVQNSLATISDVGSIVVPNDQTVGAPSIQFVQYASGAGVLLWNGDSVAVSNYRIAQTTGSWIIVENNVGNVVSVVPESAGGLRMGTANDCGINRVAASVIKSTNGSTGIGWFYTAGESRVATDVTNDSATFADITGLSATLLASSHFGFHAMLAVATGAVVEGVKVDIAGTATVTNIIADIEIKSHAATPVFTLGRLATLGGGTGVGQTVADAGNASVEIAGTFSVNAAGTFKLQFAKNADTGAANTTIKRGSWMRVWYIP